MEISLRGPTSSLVRQPIWQTAPTAPNYMHNLPQPRPKNPIIVKGQFG
jgi:hypothetical protein